ncbi:MAG: peptidoglycan-binding protein [Lachnospiraceae bacterium]|nr:peptidoglycan-binding protein [Lachnospiraceae bacterium]
MPDLYQGNLQINVTRQGLQIPVENARVTITDTGNPDRVLEQLNTDSSGQTPLFPLPAPNPEYSLEITYQQPYSEYNCLVEAEGYEPALISGTQILATTNSLQPISLRPLTNSVPGDNTVIPPHTLYGDYPPKIPEPEVKPMEESGDIVLSRIVIPEYVIVHDGPPSDNGAPDYYVKYRDYIKNVASSEIYATWPESTIYANILAIMSFTMNRVYTEYYRGRGKNFTITSSTAYDQKWMKDRNIYENIDYLVDSIFNNFLSRPGIKQPILTSYCDGNRVTCSGLSQWGSKSLGDAGYSAIDIIHYYYGDDMYINTADAISGVPSSWPGYTLSVGDSSEKVRQIQEQLARISQNYPAIPTPSADGIYGPLTAESVKIFQKVFDLPQTGAIDFATWYTISDIYVGVSRIAEPGAY